MEEIRLAAQAYYLAASEDDRKVADEFFEAMDYNGDEKISCAEFANFMTQEGYHSLNNRAFFGEIDEDKDGKLDFMEVMTIYYVLKSGRPICDGCRELVTGMYFTCWRCFNSERSFDLHPKCFEGKEYVHHHDDAFIDNFALLQVMRHKTPPHDSPPNLEVVLPSGPRKPNIGELSKTEKLKICFRALERACNIGSFGVASAVAAHGCAIL